jgi:acyl carrier protein
MLPAAFVSLDAIPLTPNGKVDRRALELMEVNLESSQAYLAPRNAMEEQLVAIWAEVLKLDPEKIGVNDNFFELGGHSLLATQVVSKIRSQLEIDVSVKVLFNVNTLAGVAEISQAIKTQHEKPSLDADLTNVEFEEVSL